MPRVFHTAGGATVTFLEAYFGGFPLVTNAGFVEPVADVLDQVFDDHSPNTIDLPGLSGYNFDALIAPYDEANGVFGDLG